MKTDIVVSEGEAKKPACVFIHGLGMNKFAWTDPTKAKVMGGLMPMSLLLRGHPEMKTLYHDLMSGGYTVAAWSQSRPLGPVRIALDELKEVIGRLEGVRHNGIILIGHSRGGLIAREAGLAGSSRENRLRGIVTLCSPHRGSGMAGWAVYASPLAALLRPLVPERQRGTLSKTLKKSVDFLQSSAVREIMPGSEFLEGMSTEKPKGAYCLSVGGTNGTLVTLPGRLALPDGIRAVMEDRILPEEMCSGKGDGLVTARSSVLSSADEHLDFPVNHAEVIVDPEVRGAVCTRINSALSRRGLFG
jgi:pimeloyl-ACP methyl ester carboxylesterase